MILIFTFAFHIRLYLADIHSVPYVTEHVLHDFVKDTGKIYDQVRTQQCLGGHKVLVLGDSVIEEFVFDLAILLSGVAKYRDGSLDKFVQEGTNADPDSEHLKLTIPHSIIEMNFCHGRRNITIVDKKLGIRIRHRFTGHAVLKANNGGLKTFFRDL